MNVLCFQITVVILSIILLRNRGYCNTCKVRRNQISCTPNSSRPSTAPTRESIDWSSTIHHNENLYSGNSTRLVQSTRPHSSRPSSAFIARSALRTRSHLADYESDDNQHFHDTQNNRFGERPATASSRRSSGNISYVIIDMNIGFDFNNY